MLQKFVSENSDSASEAIFSMVSFRNHNAHTDASFVSYQRIQTQGVVTKVDVLATLGPPLHVIGQADGDIFVYRRVASDTRIVDLNPSMVSFVTALPVPIYFNSNTSGRDDMLMVFFDAEGRARSEGARYAVERRSVDAEDAR